MPFLYLSVFHRYIIKCILKYIVFRSYSAYTIRSIPTTPSAPARFDCHLSSLSAILSFTFCFDFSLLFSVESLQFYEPNDESLGITHPLCLSRRETPPLPLAIH